MRAPRGQRRPLGFPGIWRRVMASWSGGPPDPRCARSCNQATPGETIAGAADERGRAISRRPGALHGHHQLGQAAPGPPLAARLPPQSRGGLEREGGAPLAPREQRSNTPLQPLPPGPAQRSAPAPCRGRGGRASSALAAGELCAPGSPTPRFLLPTWVRFLQLLAALAQLPALPRCRRRQVFPAN